MDIIHIEREKLQGEDRGEKSKNILVYDISYGGYLADLLDNLFTAGG